MKKYIVIPDSFKGTMSSRTLCDIMARAIEGRSPGAEIVCVPVADGGEGSVEAFLSALGGERVEAGVKGPYFEETPSFYGLLPNGTAVVEMAAAAGLPLAGGRGQVERATTYGVGQLMAHALDRGCRRLVVGLGGSATNDGGAGMAAALGAVFRNRAGEAFVPVGGTLGEIAGVDCSGLHPRLAEVPLVGMCDIDNPLCGPAGAAAVFGPQKGASAATAALLDEGLAHLADVVRRQLGRKMDRLPGAGAAGGMGYGLAALLGGRLEMGIETVLDTVGFEDMLRGADLVFTGEGRLDGQSLRGKVVVGVARRARAAGVPVVAVVGDIGDDIQGIYDEGVTAVFSINRVARPFSEVRGRSAGDLALTMESILRLLELGQG